MKRFVILFVVFLTGASVLVLEVVATRFFSPYFGNTIYSVSSIIGTVLAALSFGYYLGGIYADRHPEEQRFYKIIAWSGISVFCLHLLGEFLLPLVSLSLPLTIGPLVASVVLFFFPALLLGTLSPFAIKLQEIRCPNVGIGTLSGEVFFWSTCGSIIGSLATGFILVPTFGVDRIILGVGVVLSICGIVGYFFSRGDKQTGALMLFSSVLLVNVTGYFVLGPLAANVVFAKDGIYERISVIDLTENDHSVRYLVQDRSRSGAIYLDSTPGQPLAYAHSYKLYHLQPTVPEDIFVLGGGAYTIPRLFLQELPNARIDVAEIEPELVDIARRYFQLPNDPRLVNYIEDGRRFLASSEKKYDFLYADAFFSLFSMPSHLVTKEFYTLARSRLKQDGVMVVNFIGNLSRTKPSLLFRELRTFQSVFPNSAFFALQDKHVLTSQNIIFYGVNGAFTIESKSTEDATIKAFLKQQIDIRRYPLSQHEIFTDRFAPVEYLTARLLAQEQRTKNNQFDSDEALAILEQLQSSELESFAHIEFAALSNSQTVNVDTPIVAQFGPASKKSDKRIVLFHSLAESDFHSVTSTAVLAELGRVLALKRNELGLQVEIVLQQSTNQETAAELIKQLPRPEHIHRLYLIESVCGEVAFQETTVSIANTSLPMVRLQQSDDTKSTPPCTKKSIQSLGSKLLEALEKLSTESALT